MAECYAVLTAYPLIPIIAPPAAERLIHENIFSCFHLVPLTPADYRAAIQRVSTRSLRSGKIYDALIIQAALKEKVEALYTWNITDFQRLADPDLLIRQP